VDSSGSSASSGSSVSTNSSSASAAVSPTSDVGSASVVDCSLVLVQCDARSPGLDVAAKAGLCKEERETALRQIGCDQKHAGGMAARYLRGERELYSAAKKSRICQ